MPMDIVEALQIVIDMAKSTPASPNFVLPSEIKRRKKAIAIVEDLAVNEYGDK